MRKAAWIRWIFSKVETKEELVSTVERLRRSPLVTGADWTQET